MHRSFGIYGVSSRNGKQHVKPRLAFVRTYSGIARARDAGKCFGRPAILNEEQKQKVLERIKSGASISAIAREFRTTRQTILRFRSKQKMLLYKK